MEFMSSGANLFLTKNCFFANNFSKDCKKGNDLEFDPQNSLHEDLKEIFPEEKIKKGQTDP